MSFSLFPKRYKPLWQVIITKYNKELYNKMYSATDFMLDIRNKTQWSNDYKYEIEKLDNGLFNTYYKFTDGTVVKILMLREEII
jgi:hypothetical protein